MKKTLIIFVLIVIIVFYGCSEKTIIEDEGGINKLTDEEEAIFYEEEFLNSNSNEDLILICSNLSVTRNDHSRINQMKIKYFPIVFTRVSIDQIRDITAYGFDSWYASYVSALFTEGMKDEFYEQYYICKEKAENIYIYCMSLYTPVLYSDNLEQADIDFLYKEAVEMYEKSKRDNEDVESRTHAFGRVKEMCELMGKESELEGYTKEFVEYFEPIVEEMKKEKNE